MKTILKTILVMFLISFASDARTQETCDSLGVPENYIHDIDHLNNFATWDRGIIGQGIVIALIDTDVDIENSFLTNNRWVNPSPDNRDDFPDDFYGWNFSGYDVDEMGKILENGCNDPFFDRINNVGNTHGTFVAGVALGAMEPLNATPETLVFSGVAPESQLMNLNWVSTDSVFGPEGYVAAIRYAADSGAQIIGTMTNVGEGLPSGVRDTPCLLYTSPSPRDRQKSRMPSSA